MIKKGVSYDNTVPQGTEPRLLSSFEREAGERPRRGEDGSVARSIEGVGEAAPSEEQPAEEVTQLPPAEPDTTTEAPTPGPEQAKLETMRVRLCGRFRQTCSPSCPSPTKKPHRRNLSIS